MGKVIRQGSTGDAAKKFAAMLYPMISTTSCSPLVTAAMHEEQDAGVFGVVATAALMRYQRSSGLVVDGVLGPKTADWMARNPPQPLSMTDFHLVSCPWYSQRDNENDPSRTCMPTSIAMVWASMGIARQDPSVQLEDEIYAALRTPEALAVLKRDFSSMASFRPNEIHGMLVWLSRKRGIKHTFTTNASKSDLLRSIAMGKPVVLSTTWTHGGHVVVLVGRTEDAWIVNDPWGNPMTGYTSKDGRRVLVTAEKFRSGVKDAKSEKYWAHLFL